MCHVLQQSGIQTEIRHEVVVIRGVNAVLLLVVLAEDLRMFGQGHVLFRRAEKAGELLGERGIRVHEVGCSRRRDVRAVRSHGHGVEEVVIGGVVRQGVALKRVHEIIGGGQRRIERLEVETSHSVRLGVCIEIVPEQRRGQLLQRNRIVAATDSLEERRAGRIARPTVVPEPSRNIPVTVHERSHVRSELDFVDIAL